MKKRSSKKYIINSLSFLKCNIQILNLKLKIIFNIERNKFSDCRINSSCICKDFCRRLYRQGGRYMEGKIHIYAYVLRRQLSFTVLHGGWGAAVSKALSAARKTAGITAAHPAYPFSLFRHGRRGMERKGIGNRSQSCEDDRAFFFFLSRFLSQYSNTTPWQDIENN